MGYAGPKSDEYLLEGLGPGDWRGHHLYRALHHVLDHLNLFGGGYRAQAERRIEQLLAELQG